MRSTLIPTIAGLLLLIFGGQSARAQTYTVQSISPTPDIGRVVSAASGDTVFRFAASNGAVSKVSGNGVRLDSTTTRATVTIKCSNSSLCPNPVTITVAAAAVTKRARALTNFTVTAGTGMTVGAVTGTGPTVFTLAGIPRNGTGTFHLGADLGIGDDTSGATGATTAAFTVSTPTHSSSASAAANVFRTITIAQNSALGFGRIIRPSTGSNTVTVSESTG
ncbi:MAG TPA: hypothetical protein VNT25_02770, partial [Allosphingosinicella sp.]|nr:hypothetical protein [Allosphingosinicella sp.]